MTPKRIVLLGCAGCGKTTLAHDLSRMTGGDAIVLDALWPKFDGDVPAFRAAVLEAHAGKAWISDGNFALATFDLRLPRADLIVWLDRPRWLCALRAVTRTLQSSAFHRPKGLGDVLRFIWNFDRVNRPRIEATRLEHGPDVPIVHLASDREVSDFLAGFATSDRP